jgi:UDP-N-acetylglucosamine 4,6-dehydratase/5-epimerase
MFKNKKLLITGGTGSFGKTFLNKILKKDCKEIVIFSRDEKKQHDLRRNNAQKNLRFIIGDIRDKESIYGALKNIDYVFHAAALKQVPSCEFYPMEAVKTNIIGTENLINMCSLNKIRKLVCLSTDKAVEPINAMGLSKAMMEKVIISHARKKASDKMDICITRYGNVLGSRGSVLHTFINQIKNIEPLTITDPNMTRFLMTLDEAIDLVLMALKVGKNGEIFVQKSPAANTLSVANAVRILFGKPDYPIKYIGARHSEKIHESLLSQTEMQNIKRFKNYFIIPGDKRDLNYENFYTKGKKIKILKQYSSDLTNSLSPNQIIKLINDNRDLRKLFKN